jgi:hypothetical protein
MGADRGGWGRRGGAHTILRAAAAAARAARTRTARAKHSPSELAVLDKSLPAHRAKQNPSALLGLNKSDNAHRVKGLCGL